VSTNPPQHQFDLQNYGISPAVRQIITKATHREKKERFADARTMRLAVEKIMQNSQ
jgi:hypothetical protein